MSKKRLNVVVRNKGNMFPSFSESMERSSLTLPSLSSQQQRHLFFPKLMRKTFCVVSRPCERLVRWARAFASQPLVLYTVFWTSLLAVTVTVAALSLEMGFNANISSRAQDPQECTLLGSSSISCRPCFTLPVDGPKDLICIPALRFHRSKLDLIVPPIFAGLVVTGSALFVQSLHLLNE